MSMPLVRVSIALVKNRALLAPNGASSTAIGGAVKLPDSTIRSSIAM
jgi:hypothetical protein